MSFTNAWTRWIATLTFILLSPHPHAFASSDFLYVELDYLSLKEYKGFFPEKTALLSDNSIRKDYEKTVHQLNLLRNISENEFLDTTQALTFEQFQKFTPYQTVDRSKQMYLEYLTQLGEKTIAAIHLSRILDQEMTKRNISLEVEPERVAYVVNAVLKQYALDQGKVPFTRDTNGDRAPTPNSFTDISLSQLYQWFLELQQHIPQADAFEITIDWTSPVDGNHLAIANPVITAFTGVGDKTLWPEITLTFESLPTTVQDFQARIRNDLNKIYKELLREEIWRQLMHFKLPALKDRLLLAPKLQRGAILQEQSRKLAERLLTQSPIHQVYPLTNPHSIPWPQWNLNPSNLAEKLFPEKGVGSFELALKLDSIELN